MQGGAARCEGGAIARGPADAWGSGQAPEATSERDRRGAGPQGVEGLAGPDQAPNDARYLPDPTVGREVFPLVVLTGFEPVSPP
jgi:hypothetical protein